MARVELNKDDQRYIREVAKGFFEELAKETQLTVQSFSYAWQHRLDGHLRQTVAKESSKLVQCIFCGDHHFNNVKSALDDGQMHVIKMEDDGYSCEYCRCFFCSNCNKMFFGPEAAAKPSQCVKEKNACSDCGVAKPWSFDMDKLYKMMSENEELMHKCSTCKIKVKNHTLFVEQATTNINRQTDIPIENLNMRFQNLGYQNLQVNSMSNDIIHMWRNWDSLNTMGTIG